MAYFPNGLNGLEEIINNALKGVSTAVSVASDPYLPEVACRVGQLKQLEAGQVAGGCTSLPDGMTGGVGLRKLVLPLRAAVYAKQNPLIVPAAIALLIGVPMLIGYEIGRRR